MSTSTFATTAAPVPIAGTSVVDAIIVDVQAVPAATANAEAGWYASRLRERCRHPMSQHGIEQHPANTLSEDPLGSVKSVRVWSPVTVGVFAVVLAYPSALVLALKNWRALGQRQHIRPHLVGAVVLSVPLIALLLVRPQLARGIAFALNLSVFAYLREKLKADLADFASANPQIVVETRPWYTAIGWAFLGIASFLLLAISVLIVLELLGFPV